MNKKIGITTFQYAHNYGAILQLLALQRILKKLGFDPEAVNYIPKEAKELPPWRGWGLKKGNFRSNIERRLIQFKYSKDIKEKFRLFNNNHIKISSPCYAVGEVGKLVQKYDAVITGSDQVWNFNNSPVYFLEWEGGYQGKRISYAPSCGHGNQPKSKENYIKNWIQRFDSISVRDDVSKSVIEKVSGHKVQVVADPTLLVDLSDTAIEVKTPSEYIFMYVLGEEIPGGHEKMISEIRKKYKDWPVVALIASAHKPMRLDWVDYPVYDAGPGEWLFLVQNANFVYTDSFHCSLFAMKNSKDFLAYYSEETRAPRLKDISKRYGISRSITGSIEESIESKFWEQMDKSIINERIQEHVKESLKFLKEALN